MAMTRAQLTTTLGGELAEALTLAGLASTDTSGALKEPIDRAFRQLDTDEADLATAEVADGDEAKAIAFAMFFVLDRIVSALLRKMNVGGSGAKANLREQYENAKEQRAASLAMAVTYGLPDFMGRVRVVSLTGGGLDIDPFFSRDDFAVLAQSSGDDSEDVA